MYTKRGIAHMDASNMGCAISCCTGISMISPLRKARSAIMSSSLSGMKSTTSGSYALGPFLPLGS